MYLLKLCHFTGLTTNPTLERGLWTLGGYNFLSSRTEISKDWKIFRCLPSSPFRSFKKISFSDRLFISETQWCVFKYSVREYGTSWQKCRPSAFRGVSLWAGSTKYCYDRILSLQKRLTYVLSEASAWCSRCTWHSSNQGKSCAMGVQEQQFKWHWLIWCRLLWRDYFTPFSCSVHANLSADTYIVHNLNLSKPPQAFIMEPNLRIMKDD